MSKLVRGDFGIDIMMHDYFGKRPGLYVYNGKDNYAVKVGNFASEEKARIFEEYLCYICGLNGHGEPKEG